MANTFNNAEVQLSTTGVTDIYQCPAAAGSVAILLSIIAANVNGGSSADITISVTNSSNTTLSHLAFTIPVPADTSLEVVPNKVILKAGEKIRAQASSANFFHITLGCLEITP